MAKYTRQEIEEMLAGGIYKVTFTKVTDASLCTMICTRDFGWLSQPEIADELGYEDPHGGFCHNKNTIVWCIERQREGEKMESINDWRSFDAACVEKIEFFSPTQDDDIEVEEL